MGQYKKLLLALMSGTQDKNFRFSDLQLILDRTGFSHRIRGDHHIYTRADVAEIVNIQPNGNQAKPYQCRQVRQIILKYHLGGGLLNEI